MKKIRKEWRIAFCVVLVLISYFWITKFQKWKIEKNIKDGVILPLSEVKPGMRGFGLTVFQGVEPEKFQTEIIGINYEPQEIVYPSILVKISGGPDNIAETVGIAKGMSGSPVYYSDGRIICIISGQWPFSKEAIAIATPIEETLKIEQIASKYIASSEKMSDVFLKQRLAKKKSIKAKKNLLKTTLDFFKEPFLFFEKTPKLKPGSVIYIPYIQGDINWGIYGTIGYMKENKVFSFGHDLEEEGEIKLPFYQAEVLFSRPSFGTSMKHRGRIIPQNFGAIIKDYRSGVLGIFNEVAPTVPLTIDVSKDGLKKSFNFKLANGTKDFPIFPDKTVTLLLNHLLVPSNSRDLTIKIGGEIFFETLFKPIKFDNIFVHRIESPLGEGVETIKIEKRYQNYIESKILKPFFESAFNFKIRKIDLDINIWNEKRLFILEKALLQKEKVWPGEEVKILLIFKSADSENDSFFVIQPKIRIPFDIRHRKQAIKNNAEEKEIETKEMLENIIKVSQGIHTIEIVDGSHFTEENQDKPLSFQEFAERIQNNLKSNNRLFLIAEFGEQEKTARLFKDGLYEKWTEKQARELKINNRDKKAKIIQEISLPPGFEDFAVEANAKLSFTVEAKEQKDKKEDTKDKNE